MEFIDLKRQYRELEVSIRENMDRVLEHGQYILGPEVKELEEKLAAYVGVKHCISVANGTDALMVSMMALGIQPGDEVITSPFSFIANAEMIALLGAKPVFVDINPLNFNIDANLIEQAITSKTKCIMPISLYGQCADMHKINYIAGQYHIPVIEDGAQSFGATYHGKKSGSLSTIGCTSFFPSKPLGCYGDGGACFTNDDIVAKKLTQIRTHGQEKRYHHGLLGMNSRLDTLQAAILLAKLKNFDAEVEARIRIGRRYNELLKNYVQVTQIAEGNTCVYAQYTITVPNRARVQEYLKQKNIPTAVHYPIPLHWQSIFSEYKNISLPNAESAAQSVMSLPMHPFLTEADQDTIVENLLSALDIEQKNIAV